MKISATFLAGDFGPRPWTGSEQTNLNIYNDVFLSAMVTSSSCTVSARSPAPGNL